VFTSEVTTSARMLSRSHPLSFGAVRRLKYLVEGVRYCPGRVVLSRWTYFSSNSHVMPLNASDRTRRYFHSSNSRCLPRPIRTYTTAGTEMSARNRRPTTGRASAVRSPRFGNAKVRVAVAWMHGSAGRTVVVSKPLGVSREKVGTSVPLAR
jgi:hypothetical protein